MIDRFGRSISYLRVSVTDRCDLRCVYCMSETMRFKPRSEVLSIEELYRATAAFIRLGVRKVRLTGGEPLVRGGILDLVKALGAHLDRGDLDELTLTTNGTRLARHADALAALGVRRVNVSLDSLQADRFRAITRHGDLAQVLGGIEAARRAGLKVRVNTVALRGVNEDEIADLVLWCGRRGFDLCLIETMPLGDIDGDRTDHYLPLSLVRARLAHRFTLTETDYRSGGPARYAVCGETGHRVGFITPMTHTFCESCNRVRLTCTGRIYMCLGRDDRADLRSALRGTEGDDTALEAVIRAAVDRKPAGHDFVIDRNSRPALGRHMSVTGG